MNANSSPQSATRRDFLRNAAGATAFALAAPGIIVREKAFGANTDTLKLGLIGCGGRGTGAAGNALTADPNTVLHAVGDIFPDQIKGSLNSLKKDFDNRVAVTEDTQFVGLDAYKKVVDSGVDVVLLATPPYFRALHLRYAVEKGKQIFCEKPVATTSAGIRHAMESVRIAKEKKLNFVCGFCWRSDLPRRALYQKLHEGAMGDIRGVYGTYLTGPVKPMQAPENRKPGVTDLEWQLRNWMNFSWLSGDGIVEQCIHTVDKLAWCMKDVAPLKATASGGRVNPNYEGNIFDHVTVVYEYADGVRGVIAQRQVPGCYNDNSDYIIGTKGHARSGWGTPAIIGENKWRYQGDKPDMYVVEHQDLFAGIRGGERRFDGDWLISSCLQGIMGRLAAYTGQEVTWEQALNSNEKLGPEPGIDLAWDGAVPIMPMPVPGRYKLA
jgi:myo-inositol 2-dehydrogenase / D-chiro-inositol 1-dehydrogenase